VATPTIFADCEGGSAGLPTEARLRSDRAKVGVERDLSPLPSSDRSAARRTTSPEQGRPLPFPDPPAQQLRPPTRSSRSSLRPPNYAGRLLIPACRANGRQLKVHVPLCTAYQPEYEPSSFGITPTK
jgi:hypothetical protein